jgi:hypothetical protein
MLNSGMSLARIIFSLLAECLLIFKTFIYPLASGMVSDLINNFVFLSATPDHDVIRVPDSPLTIRSLFSFLKLKYLLFILCLISLFVSCVYLLLVSFFMDFLFQLTICFTCIPLIFFSTYSIAVFEYLLW